ncbi:hypothetical protein CC80DRAFT_496806 [Byssothecium circinans]|uniref:Uncharacterized protein n=1 Tax=Byssothecium circinans TaxID=147558 RepID=A0A6A5TIE5_9PLEO|nr:hypothetical protein CC80DRAFT_496806 [Byssothecium circinans]
MAATTALEHVCLPTNLDAFVLNEAVCNSGLTRIAPITQPNYVSLRLDNHTIQHDVLPNIDLHNSRPASLNPRISKAYTAEFHDLDQEDPRPPPEELGAGIDRSRLGIYLHWTIPRLYRSAKSQAAPPPSKDPKAPALAQTNPSPVFPRVPNRWLIVRILRDFTPRSAKPDTAAAWVVESDKLRKVDDLDSSVDLETDVTPFVAYAGDATTNKNILDDQAENYIGLKTPLASWTETAEAGATDRVPLTIMNSSNPLFADYAIHNPNVFSTKDNLQYGTDKDGKPLYLETAVCDYVVVGWHSDAIYDPLATISDPDNPLDLGSRLKALFCASPINEDEKKSTAPSTHTVDTDHGPEDTSSLATTRLICHAARYGVTYNTTKPKTPGDTYAANFGDNVDMEPVSLGTSPLDAMLAFFQAHQLDKKFEETVLEDPNTDARTTGTTGTTDPDDPNNNTDKTFSVLQIADLLMNMRELLYATEDDYDSRVKAADLVFAHNFGRTQGGSTWHYDKKKGQNGPPAEPSTDPDSDRFSELDYLTQLNEYQQIWDAVDRKLNQLRWALFAEFFKYVSDTSNLGDSAGKGRIELYSKRVPLLQKEYGHLQTIQTTAETNMNKLMKKIPARKIANDPFFKRTDPSLCMAGIDAGWDPEFLSNTPTRFVGKLSPPGKQDTTTVRKTIDMIEARLPSTVFQTVSGLVNEASGGYQDTLTKLGHKQWTEQPFAPQFVEWEGIYYHIDDAEWEIDLATSALSGSNHSQVTYVNPRKLSTPTDQRHITGRMLVLPQPSFALGAVVAQVLGATPVSQLPPVLQTAENKKKFTTGVQGLKFISGELTGLTDALLTMANGQHVKPNVRVQGKDPVPMAPAVTAGKNILLNDVDFTFMGGESGRTPYGTLTDFTNVNPKPFKAVQHGQFAITKLTIVDKFGQAIPLPITGAPDRPNRVSNPSKTPDFIHPCLSEQLIPSLLDGELNTVYTTKQTQDMATSSGYPMTPFAQLTPAINQEARINASFLLAPDAKKKTTWKICSDWENPIFGWVLVNYADSALQFFTGEGIFYTALVFGGPKGTVETKKWLPFEPPDQADAMVSQQLDDLIKKMTGDNGNKYLLAMWDLIRRAIPSMPFPPSDYAQYANAIVGKPLALVNVGWSLELAQPPWWPQHTLPAPPEIPSGATIDPLRTDAAEFLTRYPFPVKIGDADRPFDGVVAYWDATDSDPFKTIHTYFPDPKTDDGIRLNITSDKFPQLNPYFLDPEPFAESTNKSGYTTAQTAKLMKKVVLVDPYTPIHLYSSILPIKSLQLPAWTLQGAMKNMTAFFIMGPLLLTIDVPKLYDATRPLLPTTWLSNQKNGATTTNAAAQVKLPIAGGKGLWNWLQPYYVLPKKSDANAGGVVATTATTGATHYNSLEVGQDDGRLALPPGPYTFVEGFMQLARPLVSEGVPLPAGR